LTGCSGPASRTGSLKAMQARECRKVLSARAAVVFNTSNTTEEREAAIFGDPPEALWKRCIFGLCGIARIERRVFSVVVTRTEKERQGWPAEVR
jgi:NAD(P)H dehydrogenase (quinone)